MFNHTTPLPALSLQPQPPRATAGPSGVRSGAVAPGGLSQDRRLAPAAPGREQNTRAGDRGGVHLSDAEHAAIIRGKLKAAGITSRRVSVRITPGGSIRATIKDLRVRKAVVLDACAGHEHIDRDQGGEILSGGNRFVFVDYDDEVVRDAAAPLAHFIADEIAAKPSAPVELAHDFVIERRHSWDFHVWRLGKEFAPFHANSAEAAARHYIERLAELGLP